MSAEESRRAAACAAKFLQSQAESGALRAEVRESVEVALQCVQAGYGLQAGELQAAPDLVALLRGAGPPPTDEARAEAELLKTRGNDLMKAERAAEALELYTRALRLDSGNAVYFCNRAAAHFKLGAHETAAADCAAALALRPDYGKAHGRLGLALAALGRHREARASFARAAQLDPDNESYRTNVRLADERLAAESRRGAGAGAGGVGPELAAMLQDPALLGLATQMLQEPAMQQLISGLVAPGGAAGAAGVLEAGQALAQQVQAAHPDLLDRLRRQMQPPTAAPPTPPADGSPGDQQPPAP